MASFNSVFVKPCCPFCHKQFEIEIPVYNLVDWYNGAKIQDCLPHLTESERELLVSGICDNCWKAIFSDDPYTEDLLDDFEE